MKGCSFVIENSVNNHVNTGVASNSGSAENVNISQNQYYNIFSKEQETFEFPDFDLEFNRFINPDTTTFMKTS